MTLSGDTIEEALYLKDSYLKEFEAEVISVMEKKKIILDNTAFYPSSGGQPCDLGVIRKGDSAYNILSVKKVEGAIVHEVDSPGLAIGDEVRCTIDWPRRYMLMRMHTAAHIISQIIHLETKALITGNQLDLDKSRIDFSVDDYDPEKLKEYIVEANNIVKKDLPITAKFMPRYEAEQIPQLSKLAKGLPESIHTVRVLYIGDFDTQADGGTHVKSTKEVGTIAFVKSENKGKNNRRMYFSLV